MNSMCNIQTQQAFQLERIPFLGISALLEPRLEPGLYLVGDKL